MFVQYDWLQVVSLQNLSLTKSLFGSATTAEKLSFLFIFTGFGVASADKMAKLAVVVVVLAVVVVTCAVVVVTMDVVDVIMAVVVVVGVAVDGA